MESIIKVIGIMIEKMVMVLCKIKTQEFIIKVFGKIIYMMVKVNYN